jgi:hypothetical protein
VAAIPHMNDIASHYQKDVVCVGISDEAAGTVQNFMRSKAMNYAVATDPGRRMYSVFGIRAIPHVVVISADWIVRWQGHPGDLTEGVIDQLVEANRKLVATAGGANGGGRYRWTGGGT